MIMDGLNDHLIYLASPYSSKDSDIRESRYNWACSAVNDLISLGFLVYSPIVHFAYVAEEYNLPMDFDFWQGINKAMLSRCQELLVLTIPGWEKSKGVQAEIEMAEEIGIPIRYTRHGSRGRD